MRRSIMKTKFNILIIVSLVAMLILTSSCTRKAVDTPGPTGPSTYAIVIEADASPNVIIASDTRDETIITATVTNFQGIALSNETVVFDIIDPTTMQPAENAGYFEGNKTVVTRVTDSNGAVSVKYIGPLVDEIIHSETDEPPPDELVEEPPVEVYIRASLSWRGEQFVVDYAPIEIIIDFKDLELFLRADPNVLFIAGGPQKSILTATLRKVEGAPVKGRKIFFSFLTGPGEVQSGKRTAFVTTNANGEANVTYVSPDRNHIGSDRIKVTIRAHLETEDPNWAHAETSVWLYRGN
jgi:hypothetical protein